MAKDILIARWETRGKRYWYELYKWGSGRGYYYKMNNGGGSLGSMSKIAAIQYLEIQMAAAAAVDGIHYKGVYLRLPTLRPRRTTR